MSDNLHHLQQRGGQAKPPVAILHSETVAHELQRVVQDQSGEQRSSHPASLVTTLCRALADEEIVYCHWKSNNALQRSVEGSNDLDLLVRQADMLRFIQIVCRLGFKPAQAPNQKQMPGVLDYFGYDVETERLIHVHAHYQLIVGHDMTKNYRLPVEAPYLASAEQKLHFKVPAPEFEYIVFVIRMILKHATWDVMLARQGSLTKNERQELAYLQDCIDPDRVKTFVQKHLPYLSEELFADCVKALQPDCSLWRRAITGHRLQTTLEAYARRSVSNDIVVKLWRRVAMAIRRRTARAIPKYRLARGGAMIAIVGGDGAGKSTAIDALYEWLAKHFDTTKVHMGKPAWSGTTVLIRSFLKIGSLLGLYPEESTYQETIGQQSPISVGYPWLLREVCRARDRYQFYLRARRIAAAGGLVLLDRFPVPEIESMDGPLMEKFVHELNQTPQHARWLVPQSESRFVHKLRALERQFYERIIEPDVLIVLIVHPKIAVQRKTDEDASSVYKRSSEIWHIDWSQTGAHVVDGARAKDQVQAELKALIWSKL